MKYIKKPHLPEGEVRHVIIGEKYRNKLETALLKHNIEAIWMPDNPFVDMRLSGHSDLSAVHICENKLYLSEYMLRHKIVTLLTELGFDVLTFDNPRGTEYPEDAGCNVCVIDDKIIANKKTAYKTILNCFAEKEMISCRQGYSKCAVCVVDENSIITSDKKIAEKSVNAGMNVLQIEDGITRLDGFKYGFIGGASFKISKNKMAFTGIIKNESVKNKIERFLSERNVKPIYLTEEEIFDIGSAILLTER